MCTDIYLSWWLCRILENDYARNVKVTTLDVEVSQSYPRNAWHIERPRHPKSGEALTSEVWKVPTYEVWRGPDI